MKKFRVFPLLLLLCLAMSLIAPAAAALDDPLVAAQAVILLNEETGEILYEKNADERRTPASLTKMMTGLLLCEAVESGRVNLDDAVAAGLDCQNGLVEGATNASIVSGEVMTLKDLFYCAMVASANDACNVIGSYLSGSIDAFVDEMNDRAAALGCRDTHFVDPN
jgi:D-alanyl-D-alanine carboxypeptidase (penicillin-binding protein 5/6)